MTVIIGSCLILFLYFLTGYLISFRIRTVNYTLTSDKINEPVKIAVVSDLHSTWYGKNQSTLINTLKQIHPDLILMPGDIVDDKKGPAGAVSFVQQVTQIAPCYYCPGNHEKKGKKMSVEDAMKIISDAGIPILDGKSMEIVCNGNTLTLCGIQDPRYNKHDDQPVEEDLRLMQEAGFDHVGEHWTVLLAHRPERAEEYSRFPFDLIVSGHAHGGQVRIPGLINGLFAPQQGLFPKLAGGQYQMNQTTLIVSRGLCRRWYLPRIYNPEEIPVIELKKS